MMGFTTKDARVKATPVKRTVFVPLANTIPEIANEIRYKDTAFIRKYFRACRIMV